MPAGSWLPASSLVCRTRWHGCTSLAAAILTHNKLQYPPLAPSKGGWCMPVCSSVGLVRMTVRAQLHSADAMRASACQLCGADGLMAPNARTMHHVGASSGPHMLLGSPRQPASIVMLLATPPWSAATKSRCAPLNEESRAPVVVTFPPKHQKIRAGTAVQRRGCGRAQQLPQRLC